MTAGRRTVHGKGRRAKVLEPFEVDLRTWFYADAAGFTFVRQVYGVNTDQFKVPVRLLRAALALLEPKGRP